MKRLRLLPLILCIPLCLPAIADEPPVTPQLQNGVKFVSGGIGVDEIKAMQAMRGDYNVSLLFIVKGSGAYLDDVDIRITGLNGVSVLETTSQGPKLFAKLKPGRYSVRAAQAERVIEKTISVGNKRMTSVSFAWPQDQEN